MKHTLSIVRLRCKPNAQFHFGTVAYEENMALNESANRLHSDTLFSALISEYHKIWNDTDTFVQRFQSNELQISSASYYLEKENKQIYFFPKPVHCSYFKDIIPEHRKDIKSLEFVSKEILENGILPHQWIDENVVIQNTFVCTPKEAAALGLSAEKLKHRKIFEFNDETKVKVHSVSKSNTLYHQTNLQIGNFSELGIMVGFWFAYEVKDDKSNYFNRFVSLLNMLQNTGIGGQRSTGCGFFEELEPDTLEYTASSQNYLSLSLISPYQLKLSVIPSFKLNSSLIRPRRFWINSNKNELENLLHYDICFRGGRHSGSDGKILQTLRMIREGAILNAPIKGNIVDISPDSKKTFLRYGKAFLLPLHPNFNLSL